MSIGATAELESQRKLESARSDLAHLEGLGDNCEFGFVLGRLGFDDGMLFRWAAIRPQSLLATLRGDFKAIYEFENLVPHQAVMVRDLRYGTTSHTQLYCSRRDGNSVFNTDSVSRQVIYDSEASRLACLLGKLQRKFRYPNPVFVIKANAGISKEVLEAIHYQIYRRATPPHFLLLEVKEDAARAGTVELVDRNRMSGYVTHFAPYDQSEHANDRSWLAVLQQALTYNAEAPARLDVTPPVIVPAGVHLPFPIGTGPDLLAPVPGDLRSGMPSRIHGRTWCRIVDEDTYRLHATHRDPDATALRWAGAHLPPNFVLTIKAWCAIAESLPVRATLEIVGSDGTILRKQHVFDRVEVREFSVSGPVNVPNPLTVSLYVEPLVPLQINERAVVDVDSIKVTS